MRALWHKTVALFWERPVLWLPVLVADALRFGAAYGRRPLFLFLVKHWHASAHSVLAGDVPAAPQMTIGITLVAAVIRFADSYLTLVLWCSAFVMVACSVRCPEVRGNGQLMREGWISLRIRFGRVLLFSLGLFAVFAITDFLEALPFILSRWVPRAEHFMLQPAVGWMLGHALLAALAYFIAGYTWWVLRRDWRFDTQERVRAGFLAVLTVIASQVVFFAADHAKLSLETHQQALLAQLCISLIAALPYVLLFFALGVMTFGNDKPPIVRDFLDGNDESVAEHNRALRIPEA